MEPPNLLNRQFDLDIQPTTVFLTCLEEMKKLADEAILIVTPYGSIRIFTPHRHHYSCAVLDIDSRHIFASPNADGNFLRFNLDTWIRALRAPIFREPGASLSISKSSGSMDIFGILGVDSKQIRLGEAVFVQIYALYRLDQNLPRCVVVTMTSKQFKEFVRAFEINHGDRVSEVEVQITKTLIRCVTPIGHSIHRAEKFDITGFEPGGSFHFRLRWNEPLFEMLCSAATASDSVELSVIRNSRGEKLYMFRFSRCNATDAFYYVEKEPHPDTHLRNGV